MRQRPRSSFGERNRRHSCGCTRINITPGGNRRRHQRQSRALPGWRHTNDDLRRKVGARAHFRIAPFSRKTRTNRHGKNVPDGAHRTRNKVGARVPGALNAERRTTSENRYRRHQQRIMVSHTHGGHSKSLWCTFQRASPGRIKSDARSHFRLASAVTLHHSLRK